MKEAVTLIGFWKSKEQPDLPMPEARTENWRHQNSFMLDLMALQEQLPRAMFRGMSRCRICNKMNGCGEYTFKGFKWPEGLLHYVKEHNVKPPAVFIAFVQSEIKPGERIKLENVKTVVVKETQYKHNVLSWACEFDPPLPYDERTKGMPYKAANIYAVDIQDENNHFVQHYVIALGGSKTDFHRILPSTSDIPSLEDLNKVLKKHMGYKIVESEDFIKQKALAKLTEDERKVLGI
jgi:hypothetical protein